VIGDFSGALTVGLLVPHCHKIIDDDPDDEYHHLVRVHDPTTRSWATVEVRHGQAAYPVRQHGPRRLWDEIEHAHAWWVHHGRPTHTRLGLTVTNTQQWTWLDHPDQPVRLPTPGGGRNPVGQLVTVDLSGVRADRCHASEEAT
jgi:hypothetical protein